MALALEAACKQRSDPRERQSAPGKRPTGNLIVVLGSSTAAGVGPSSPDKAWVARYARYLAERFPSYAIVNLAVGGQTTYHVQPTGFVPPPGRPPPAASKNVTAALELAPRAVLLNMPSNDAAEGFATIEQLANFERIARLLEAAQVPLWVTTTQPRNFTKPEQLAAQVEVRDFILRRFSPRTLDFWTPFASPSRRLLERYDAGDGTHLNDAAHERLLELVIAAAIPQSLSSAARPL